MDSRPSQTSPEAGTTTPGPRPVAIAAITTVLSALIGGACHTVFDGEIGAFACSQEGSFGPPACPDDQTCVTGACVAIGRPLGAGCDTDAQCQTDSFCLDPADIDQTGPPLCARLCCASTDCGPPDSGQVCWPPPGGSGNVCWPASPLGRHAPGAAPAGTACGDDGECRSAVCDQGVCLDTCCDNSYCQASKDVCRVMLSPLAEHDTWVCAPPPSTANADFCASSNDCQAALCLAVTEDVKVCAQPCCSSRECGSVYLGVAFQPLACAPTPDGTLRTCSRLLTEAAIRDIGAPCLEDGQCRSGLCITTGADAPYCSDSCCTDANCGDIASFACRPVDNDGTWALRCVHK
jgi:hypothetical protein